jgi:hypothetical protein
LDYLTQQQRVLPSVAAALAFLCAADHTIRLFKATQAALDESAWFNVFLNILLL